MGILSAGDTLYVSLLGTLVLFVGPGEVAARGAGFWVIRAAHPLVVVCRPAGRRYCKSCSRPIQPKLTIRSKTRVRHAKTLISCTCMIRQHHELKCFSSRPGHARLRGQPRGRAAARPHLRKRDRDLHPVRPGLEALPRHYPGSRLSGAPTPGRSDGRRGQPRLAEVAGDWREATRPFRMIILIFIGSLAIGHAGLRVEEPQRTTARAQA
jgi:hypothetical protein